LELGHRLICFTAEPQGLRFAQPIVALLGLLSPDRLGYGAIGFENLLRNGWSANRPAAYRRRGQNPKGAGQQPAAAHHSIRREARDDTRLQYDGNGNGRLTHVHRRPADSVYPQVVAVVPFEQYVDTQLT